MIKDCVESIYDQVDRIIAVDGKYRDFPAGNWYSTDGTIEYLSEWDKIELLFAANLFEADKRNVYMDMLQEGDTVLVLDADEVVEGKLKKLEKGIDIGLVLFNDLNNRSFGRLATRFFTYRKGLRHSGIHFILTIGGKWFNNRRNALNGFKSKRIQSFKINHLTRRRSRDRKLQKQEYKRVARLREEQYKIAPYE